MDNYENIVGSYESFLIGVAQLSDRLNVAPLKTVAKHIFNCSSLEANKFSTQLVEAFKFCRSKMKGYQGTPGKDWHKSVSAVVHKMYTKPNLLSKKTNEDLSPKTSPRTSPTKSDSGDQLLALGDRQVQLSNNYIVRYAQIQSNMYTSVSIYIRITKHACTFYSTHQVPAKTTPCSESDAMTPSPIKARASVEIYNLYGVTMPSYFEVQSSPERILSQAAPDDAGYVEQSSESSLKDMATQVAPAYVPNEKRRRIGEKTPPKKQLQIVASNDPDYVDLVRKVDMELVRTYKDSSQQVVKLTEGPSGFCVALMKEGMITTEIPVMSLVGIKPKPEEKKVKVVKGKPAAFFKKNRLARSKVDCIVCSH